MDKIETKRLTYEHQGRKIYEWEQSLEEVQVFIEVPPGVTAKMLAVKMTAKQLTIGLKGNPPFIDVRDLPELAPGQAPNAQACILVRRSPLSKRSTRMRACGRSVRAATCTVHPTRRLYRVSDPSSDPRCPWRRGWSAELIHRQGLKRNNMGVTPGWAHEK